MKNSFFEVCLKKIENTLYSSKDKTHKNRLFLMEKFLFDNDFQKDILKKNLIPDSSSEMTSAILACFYTKYIQEKGLN